ncbi:MAG: carbamoylphosphate synthase large subunit short form, partial [Flavobacterium sp.]|nr:carbamoylphosphate synthase large subunit short form [Flavobacterium sp.]
MKKVINVLVFPCGNENAIEILNALSGDLSIRVFGGSSEDNHGQLVFKNYIGDIPFANHPAFFDTLNSIVEKHNIHVLFPTHDAVVDILAKNREK